MMIHLDSHVHVYDYYNLDRLCDAMIRHAGKEAVPAMFLAEREGQGTFFEWMEAAREGRPMKAATRWRPISTPDDFTVVLGDGIREIYVFAARQVAARERVEALGLFTTAPIPDGLPLEETIARIREAGGLPVLAWGVGKWLFKRGRLVRSILDASEPDSLFIGDSALRPRMWGTPVPMRAARKRGMRILCGSDPLPRKDDELRAGSYATLVPGNLDPESPSECMRDLLSYPANSLRRAGRRLGLFQFLARLKG